MNYIQKEKLIENIKDKKGDYYDYLKTIILDTNQSKST